MGRGRLHELVDQVNTKAHGRKLASSPYVGLEHIEPGARSLTSTAPSSVSESTNGVFEKGDVLFGKLRPNLRKAVQVDFGGYCSTDFLVLRPRAGVDARYAGHVVSSEAVFRHAERNSIGTGMPRTSWYAVSQARVWAPPLEEQRRIAEILDTIDEAIHATERVIAKRTAKLEGLIEELAGRWTRTAIAHLVLGDMLDTRMDYRGRTPRKLGMEWGGGEIPALSANNVQMGKIDFDRECYLGSDSLYRRWMTNGHTERGDLLITMEAPLGNVACVPDGRRYILSQRVVLLRFSRTLLLNDFAYWYMRSESFQSELRRRSTGTTATGIRRAELERIEVPSVDLQQQQAAAAALSAQELALSGEQEVLRKLQEMRTGLAADLLSGRVRTVTA